MLWRIQCRKAAFLAGFSPMAILLQQTEQGINRDVTGKHSGNLRSGTGNFKDNSIRFK
jgi:hypothetical protein